MKFTLKMRAEAERGGGWLGATLAACAGLIFLLPPIGNGLAELSYDLPFVFRSSAEEGDAVIVSMDAESHGRLGQNEFQRWDRGLHARLVERLREMHARAVVFDVVFFGTNGVVEDEELTRAARRHGKVAVGALATPIFSHGQPSGWKLMKPFAELERVVAVGVVEAGDENKSVRQHYFRRDFDLPSLAWQAARLSGTMDSSRGLPDPYSERWLNFYGPPGLFPTLPYWEVLEPRRPHREALSNKVVFVGAGYPIGPAGGRGTDDFRTPFTRWTKQRAAGVEIVATAYLNVVRGDWLRRFSPTLEAMVVAVLGGVAGWGLTLCRPRQAVWVAGLCCLGVAGGAVFLWASQRIWFPWLVVATVQVPVALGWSLYRGVRQISEQAERTLDAISLPSLKPSRLPLSPLVKVEVDSSGPAPAIPDHQLLRRIGEGSYGEVWLARDIIGTYHAVKIVRRGDLPDEGAYEREFHGIRKFTPISRAHPGLVQILHVGRNDAAKYIYYVMEAADDAQSGARIDPERYVARNLAREIQRRKPLPVDECITLGVQLAAALDFLHGQRLIHRDIKPANIIYVGGAPKLADIGLVTEVAEKGGEVSYLGTKGYIAPEGPGAAGGDVYSLGKVLYEASVGLAVDRFPELPPGFFGEGRQAAFFKLNQIVLRACENDPSKRYPSAAVLRDELLRLRCSSPNLASAS